MVSWKSILNICVKTLVLFAGINLLFANGDYLSRIGKISIYNTFVPGRLRFPFGEDPTRTYNLSLYNLEAMFQSHEIEAISEDQTGLRVFVLGDSSVWGTLLKPEETLSGQLNSLAMTDCANRMLKFYNLGYPTLSLTKDAMILEEAMKYSPDLIIWPVTLESFIRKNQLESPIVSHNINKIKLIYDKYQLTYPGIDKMGDAALINRTLIGQRREVADVIRLQLYGVMWAATGIDQEYPENFPPAQKDLDSDIVYHDWRAWRMPADELSLDILAAGYKIAGKTPIILINEPILISDGQNSDKRYNYYYPRWAYDEYRNIISSYAEENQLIYMDLWDTIPAEEFTNSAIHLNKNGVEKTANQIKEKILNTFCP